MANDREALIERADEIKAALDDPRVRLKVIEWSGGLYHKDAAALIEALEAELEQVRRERDAAVEDISGTDIPCNACAHYDRATACEDIDRTCLRCDQDCPCAKCDGKNFEWRGAGEQIKPWFGGE